MMDSTEGIDEGLYGNGDRADKNPKKSIDQEESENPTGLIPKSLLAGKDFQPGDEIMLKIVADHGDEVEVEYASDKPEEKSEPGASDELDSINKEF